jgi:hypothetical protein
MVRLGWRGMPEETEIRSLRLKCGSVQDDSV